MGAVQDLENRESSLGVVYMKISQGENVDLSKYILLFSF